MRKIMLTALLVAAPLSHAAQAAPDWVKVRQGGFGVDVCFDQNSVAKDSVGITHYQIELCGDSVAMPYAIDCSQDFTQPIALRQHYLPHGTIRDHWIDRVEATDEAEFLDAKRACGK